MQTLTVVVLALLLVGQGIHEAPAHAPPDGRLAPAGEAAGAAGAERQAFERPSQPQVSAN